MSRPGNPSFTTVNVGAADPRALATFWSALLGWPIAVAEDDWCVLRDPAGGVGVSFQHEPGHTAPTWPPVEGEQQMMMHLEISVDDLDAGVAFAVACGATVADHQPQDDVRVCLDPAGHPFCLWLLR